MLKKRLWAVISDNRAFVKYDQVVRYGVNIRNDMGGNYYNALLFKSHHYPLELLTFEWVKTSRRLVKNQYLGGVKDSLCNGKALFHSARK